MADGMSNASDPSAVARWRQRIAGVLLIAGAFVLVASYFLPWSSGFRTNIHNTCCVPDVGSFTAWPLMSPFVVHWDHLLRTLAQGNPFALLVVIVLGFQFVAPVAFVALGWRLLTRVAPAPLRWRVLVVLYCLPEAFVVWELLDLTLWNGNYSLSPTVGFYLACAAVAGLFVSGVLMPSSRRQPRAGAVPAM